MSKLTIRIITIVMAVAVAACAIWIMANRLGLNDKFDFGAGAYYYADIPNFDKVIRDDTYTTSVPVWVHIVLFLGWGWLMWRLWCWVDSRKAK